MNVFTVALLFSAASGGADPSACSLLTTPELESAQSAKVVEAKASLRPEKGFEARQCFFRLEPFSRSVSLEVTRTDAPHPAGGALQERWDSIFHEGSREETRRRGEREERASAKPVPVAGLGKEAFWLPNTASGALYVLGPAFYFRVSVGGGDPSEAKLAKCRALAEKVLAKSGR